MYIDLVMVPEPGDTIELGLPFCDIPARTPLTVHRVHPDHTVVTVESPFFMIPFGLYTVTKGKEAVLHSPLPELKQVVEDALTTVNPRCLASSVVLNKESLGIDDLPDEWIDRQVREALWKHVVERADLPVTKIPGLGTNEIRRELLAVIYTPRELAGVVLEMADHIRKQFGVPFALEEGVTYRCADGNIRHIRRMDDTHVWCAWTPVWMEGDDEDEIVWIDLPALRRDEEEVNFLGGRILKIHPKE